MPTTKTELEMTSADSSVSADAKSLLAKKDKQYLQLSNGHSADVIFMDSPPTSGPKRSYIVGISGHYTYDIRNDGELNSNVEAWLLRLFTDENYLVSFVVTEYPKHKAEFLKEYYAE